MTPRWISFMLIMISVRSAPSILTAWDTQLQGRGEAKAHGSANISPHSFFGMPYGRPDFGTHGSGLGQVTAALLTSSGMW